MLIRNVDQKLALWVVLELALESELDPDLDWVVMLTPVVRRTRFKFPYKRGEV